MSAEEIKSRLNNLTADEMAVLKVVCEHPEHSDVALSSDPKGGLGYLLWSSSQVRILRREALSTLRPFTIQEVCPYILGTIDETVDETAQQLFVPPPTASIPNSTPVPTSVTPNDSPEVTEPIHHSVPMLVWALMGLLALIACGAVLRAVNLGARLQEAMPDVVTQVVEVTREIEVIVIQTVPPIEVTRIVKSVEEVPVTVETTRIVEVVAKVPVTVEVTPIPTATPTPTPLPQTVTISEDFDDFTLDPAFTVEGDPQFAEGRLNAPSQVTLKIGDETWKNYTVSFYARSLAPDQSYSGLFQTGFQMTVRDKLTSKLRFNGIWSYMNDSGEFVNLVGTEASWRWGISMIVEDDFIYFTDADGNTTTVPNTYSDSGGLTITLANAWLDNLVITRND